MPILVSGSLVYDHIMVFPDRFKNHIHLENIHILNIGFPVSKLEKSKGGTAGNIAYNLKILGSEPIIVSAVGKDGGAYINYLKKIGVDIAQINRSKKLYTASCYIITDLDDNQVSAFYKGALDLTEKIKIKDLREKPRWAIIAPANKEKMLEHLFQCAKSGLKTIFDPGQQTPVFLKGELRKAISNCQALIGNDYEIKMIIKKTEWSKKEILKRVETLVTTYGERGSRIDTRDRQEILVEACRPASIEDPTGAGDAYRAGFLVGLEKGMNLRQCARMGSVAASYAIEKYGTQEHEFTREDFKERYKGAYKEEVSL